MSRVVFSVVPSTLKFRVIKFRDFRYGVNSCTREKARNLIYRMYLRITQPNDAKYVSSLVLLNLDARR